MKTRLSVCILFILFLPGQNPMRAATNDIIELRNLYYRASANRSDAEKFEKATSAAKGIDKALLQGYSGMAWMIKANHAFNPYNKLAYFFKGRDLLDAAITADPKNVELRFLRFCVQTNAPGFLAYSGMIKTDKEIILQNYGLVTDSDLKKRIGEYLLCSKYCSGPEKDALRKG